MKKIKLLIFLFILIFSETKSQTYFKGYNLYANDNFSSGGRLIKTQDGNLILACIQKNCYTQEILGIAVTKFNIDGDVIWSRQIQSDPISHEVDIVQTSEGGYAVAYSAYNTSPIDSNAYLNYIGVIKLDSDADITWNSLVEDIKGAYSPRILQIGEQLIICYTGFQGAVHYRINFLKFSLDGNLLINKQFYAGNVSSFTGGMVIIPSNNILALGWFADSATGTNGMFKLLIDTIGNPISCKTYIGSSTISVSSCIIDADGNYVFVGTSSTIFGIFGKMTPLGDIIFFKKVEFGSSNDELYDVIQSPDKNYYVLAEPESYINKSQAGLLKFDQEGNLIWMKTYGESEGSFPFNEVMNNDGTITIAGVQASNNQSGDIYLLRVDSNGNANCFSESHTPVIEDLTFNIGSGCKEKYIVANGTAFLNEISTTIIEYSVCDTTNTNIACDTTSGLGDVDLITRSLHISPNPAHDQFQISFSGLPIENSQLCISNLLGEKVFTQKITATNQMQIDISNLAIGVYVVEIISAEWRSVAKLVKE